MKRRESRPRGALPQTPVYVQSVDKEAARASVPRRFHHHPRDYNGIARVGGVPQLSTLGHAGGPRWHHAAQEWWALTREFSGRCTPTFQPVAVCAAATGGCGREEAWPDPSKSFIIVS
eukprot:gene10343-biopygen120